MDDVKQVPVLIVGGGPVGLSVAIGLRRWGIACLLVEKHESTLDFPKGRLVSPRSMEIYRAWAIEEAIAEAGLARDESLFLFTGNTLLADSFSREGVCSKADDLNFSPTKRLLCSQDVMEPVLLQWAKKLGADVRFATKLESFTQDDHRVSATLRDERTGEISTVHATYLVAADGARSGVRAQLGIGVRGPGPLGRVVSILVEADLASRIADRRSGLYRVHHPRPVLFAVVDNERRWLMMVRDDAEAPAPASDEACLSLARESIGDPTVPVRIGGRRLWSPTGEIAERFKQGRVFLIGDAAHVMTPNGGFGMNCGIADAHNLVWKLATVLTGCAHPAVLDTYEPERQPVAEQAMAASFVMAQQLLTQPRFDAHGIFFGASYGSAAILPDGTSAPLVDDPIHDYVPVARPGHRAPHVWISYDARRTSTVDLFGRGFVLLSGGHLREAYASAFTAATQATGVAGRHCAVDEPAWCEVYGVQPDGAVLVRPDGHVAWRTATSPPDLPAAVAHALKVATGGER
ncbi:FAD-dependent monooxygenase [Pendulispora brunnea]|uniref:FAD-dependent monooxygenase n=1 Tax=Pendulispora brunnea TaxID=2905690 RepID=A0ABZ2K6Y8_9BACT